MQFNDNVVTEITAPNNVPFQPGFDIIGIGTEVPPELEAIGIEAAIVFYTSDWDANATDPRIKFFYLGTGNFLTSGVCMSNNPSTTPAHVTRTYKIGVFETGGAGFTEAQWTSIAQGGVANEKAIARIVEVATGGAFQTFGFNGTPQRPSWQMTTGSKSGDLVLFDHSAGASVIELAYSGAAQLLFFGASNSLGYGQWQACTYANGWAAVGAPSNGRRSGVGVIRFPDGTVQMSGVATGGTNAVGTYIVQLPSNLYWPRYGKRVIVSSGNAAGNITIEIDSGNGAISIRGVNAAAGETNFEASWTTQG